MLADTPFRVLIVDDEVENIQLLMETLKHEHIITAARDGARALSLASSRNPPDIILLDIMMPDMDGYEVCRQLKSGEDTRDIPVIFISALDTTQDEEKGLNLGAVDYISKPFKPAIVRARVRNHLELHKSRRELRTLARCVENSPESIVITDTEAHIEYVNPAFTQTTGYTFQEAVGKKPNILKSEMHDDSFYAELWNVITSGRVWRGEILNKKKNGALYWEEVSIAAVKNTRGETIHYVAVKKDISSRKDLEQMKEDVERIMHHDLRSPLGGIVSLPDLIRDYGNLNPEQEEMLEMLESSGQRMLRMVDMSLDLLKMERGTYTCDPRKVDPESVVRAVLAEIEPAFKYQQIQAIITQNRPDESAPLLMYAEEHLLYGILSNLIKNAFEASPDGEQVSIHLSDAPVPTIAIENRGGVPAPVRKYFFEKYKTFGKKSGTGLGTYSARLMANTMGYDLKLDISDARDTTTVTMVASGSVLWS